MVHSWLLQIISQEPRITETMTTDFGDTSGIELTATTTSTPDKLRIQGVNNSGSNFYIIYIARVIKFLILNYKY